MTGGDKAKLMKGRSSALVWAGFLVSGVIFALLFRSIDWQRFFDVLQHADLTLLSLIPLSIAAEQVLRAVKWRELLSPFAQISVIRLYGAIMAGYFSNTIAPVKVSFLVRAWIAARAGKISTSTVLGSVTLGRVIDGIVFVPLVVLAATTVTLDQHDAVVSTRLLWAALGSLILLLALCWVFMRWARGSEGRCGSSETPARHPTQAMVGACQAFHHSVCRRGELAAQVQEPRPDLRRRLPDEGHGSRASSLRRLRFRCRPLAAYLPLRDGLPRFRRGHRLDPQNRWWLHRQRRDPAAAVRHRCRIRDGHGALGVDRITADRHRKRCLRPLV